MDDATTRWSSWGSSSPCSSGTGCRSASSRSSPTLALWATGLVTTEEAVAGFGDPVVIFIATLFVVSEGIDSTGVTTWAGQAAPGAGRRPGTSRVLVAVCLLSALLTSLITLNGAVAALLPLVVMLAQRHRAAAVPAPDAGGLRRERRRAADADEQPGQRDRLRGGARTPAPARSRSSPSPWSASRCCSARSLICVLLGPAPAAPGPGAHAARPGPARRDARGAVRAHRRLLPAPGADPVRPDRPGPGRASSVGEHGDVRVVAVGVAGREARPTTDPRRRRPGGHGAPADVTSFAARPRAGRQHDRLGRRPRPAHPGGGVAEVVVPPRSTPGRRDASTPA